MKKRQLKKKHDKKHVGALVADAGIWITIAVKAKADEHSSSGWCSVAPAPILARGGCSHGHGHTWLAAPPEEGLAQRAEAAGWVQPASSEQPQRPLPTCCSRCWWWWRDEKGGGTGTPGAPCGTPTALLSRERPPPPSPAVPARHAVRIPGRGCRQPPQLGRCAGQARAAFRAPSRNR